MGISRIGFIRKLGIAGLTFLGFPKLMSADNHPKPTSAHSNSKGLTILFQGDSITDGKRTRNNDWNHVMGHGYAYLIASRLWYDFPKSDLMFYNRGVSGDKIKDLDDRWQVDTLDLKPDVLSILVGVNDVHHIVNKESSLDKWKENYITVLKRTKEALPDTLLILCEPFLLPADWSEEKANAWRAVITEMQKVVRELAKDNNAIFIEFQSPFELAAQKTSAKYWVWDGVHPMPAGHELMARQWIKGVSKKLDFIEEGFYPH